MVVEPPLADISDILRVHTPLITSINSLKAGWTTQRCVMAFHGARSL